MIVMDQVRCRGTEKVTDRLETGPPLVDVPGRVIDLSDDPLDRARTSLRRDQVGLS